MNHKDIIDEHLLTVQQVADRYGTDLKNGLTKQKVLENLKIYGNNQLTPPPKPNELLKFVKQLTGGFAFLLWIGAFLCLISFFMEPEHSNDNLYLCLILILVVVITGAFAYYQETKASGIMDSFKNLMPSKAYVIREGILQEIDAKEIVCGDLIEVKGGNKVTADIRIIEAYGCKFDNSSLTGESEPQLRVVDNQHEILIEAENIAFFSTFCTEGRARGIAIRTGDYTFIGQIANLTHQQTSETAIAKEIRRFIYLISCFSTTVGTLFFLISLSMGYSFIHAIVFFIGIIVANVPEGLLATVTVCLSLAANSLRKKNCLVKNLEAVETLGSTSIICSDKTGTLTQNRMCVSHIWFSNQVLKGCEHEQIKDLMECNDKFKDFLRVASLCSKAFRESDHPHHMRIYYGDASEVAFLKFLESIYVDVKRNRTKHELVHEIPFNSTNKFHLTIHRTNKKCNEKEQNHRYLVCLKGAPEIILNVCQSMVLDGKCKMLDKVTKNNLNAVFTYFASMGERVLAFAEFYTNDYENLINETTSNEFSLTKKFKTQANFTLLGLLSLMDPPRPEVPDAVAKCHIAGIRVFMVTGDHPITAKAIAKQVGIISKWSTQSIVLTEKNMDEFLSDEIILGSKLVKTRAFKPEAVVISGSVLDKMTTDQLDYVVQNHRELVFARTSPQQKLLIVDSCQRAGHIVAVTGDGVNDSPALKKANIGIAMGLMGTDISKKAADIILMDDNFATIVAGIEEGRVIFDNLKKSISYVMASNFAEIIPFLFYVIFGFPLALGTITILCIDLGTDIFPSMSLAYEKAEMDIMSRPPRNSQNEHLVSRKVFSFAYFQIGVLEAAAGFFAYFIVMGDHGFYISDLFQIRSYWDDKDTLLIDRQHRRWTWDDRKQLEYTCQTAFFVSIVVCQWADGIICKTRINSIFHQKMNNHVLNIAIVTETAIALILVNVPAFRVFKIYPLKWWYWLVAMPFSVYIFIYDEIRRVFIRNSPDGFFASEFYRTKTGTKVIETGL